MKHQVYLQGHKVALGVMSPEYLPLFVKWLNDQNVTQYLSQSRPLYQLEEKEFLEDIHKRKEQVVFVILAKNEGADDDEWKPIGSMGLHKIDTFHGTAVTGALIGEPDYQGGGYGSEAKLLLLRYGFDWLHLRLVLSEVHGSNERSVAYSERCGYEIQGIIKNYKWHAGRYEDQVIMAVSRERFDVIWEFYLKEQRAPRREELKTLFPTTM